GVSGGRHAPALMASGPAGPETVPIDGPVGHPAPVREPSEYGPQQQREDRKAGDRQDFDGHHPGGDQTGGERLSVSEPTVVIDPDRHGGTGRRARLGRNHAGHHATGRSPPASSHPDGLGRAVTVEVIGRALEQDGSYLTPGPLVPDLAAGGRLGGPPSHRRQHRGGGKEPDE